MKLTLELKSKIDSYSYEHLLERWRNAPVGDPMFQDESGDYWRDRMQELRSQPNGNNLHVTASKTIGW